MANTITDAVREMRTLLPTRSGRLHGIPVRHSFGSRPEQWLGNTPQPWYDRLHTAITTRTTGTPTPDSPEYLVLSDNVVVVVLTAAAHLVLPDYPLSATQTRHRTLAAQALADLPRHTLRLLADHRAAMDDRPQDAAAEYEQHPDGALRIAPAADPSNTRWIRIGADLDQARAAAGHACHTDPDQVLIITAAGYGQYGRDRHRLTLPMLCAIHEVADTQQVSLRTVGDWLHAEGATTGEVSPTDIVAQFTASYIGPFADRTTYTRHRMADLGWTEALAAAGIPERYIDLDAITRDWFGHDVRAVACGTFDRIEVFHREQPAPAHADLPVVHTRLRIKRQPTAPVVQRRPNPGTPPSHQPPRATAHTRGASGPSAAAQPPALSGLPATPAPSAPRCRHHHPPLIQEKNPCS